ncbi:hypothetical protein L1D59_17865 [Pseudoalteromonas piscicida]|uniref:hypothetical protein n=1 Tax=Pseudoalteromonas piscicida TaxID=43662 RepID=UPI001EFE6C9E|nr:hypothetical protein [Pseudoalteromonas piscicida]MCG9770464.1 hypothetical protein [Pseudoalteromonas piscicida]
METIAQTITILTALGAIVLTCWTLKTQRQHNRISVAPRLCDWLHTEDNSVHYDIINKGLGTAKVAKFTFIVDGQEMCWAEFDKDIRNYFEKELNDTHQHTSGLSSDSYIAKDERIRVLELHFLPKLELSHILERLTKRYELKVEYYSLYEEPFTYKSNLND